MTYKIITIIIFCLVFLFDIALKLIGLRSVHNPIPKNVQDVYDRESYSKWQSYHKEKTRISVYARTVSFIVDMILLIFNLYAAFAGLFQKTLFLQMLAVLLLTLISGIIDLPLTYYDTMVVEGKYGFNKTTRKTFWSDQIKEGVIGFLILIIIGSLLIWLHQLLGNWMIAAFAGVMTLILLFIAFLYPFFQKLFHKFTPLEDEELKNRLTGLLQKHDYQVRAIQIMDASKRSTKANAYFTGFGKMKTIVLYDTLLETMTGEEICAVFAHEMGHGLHRDTLKNQILSFIQMLIIGFLAWLTLTVPEVYTDFGFESLNYGFAMILIMTEFGLLFPLFSLFINAVSRRAEFRADQQAVKEGYGETLISALKKLAKRDFTDIAPDPLLVKLSYSHPTLSQRIEAITDSTKK